MKYIKYSILILILIFGYRFYTSIGGMCQNKIYKEYISLDKKKKAVIFQRDCGATTSYSTHISIIDINDILENESGNIYILKGVPKKVAPTLNWSQKNMLIINTKITGNEFKVVKEFGWFNKINIKYQK
jgi:hypothetical protein